MTIEGRKRSLGCRRWDLLRRRDGAQGDAGPSARALPASRRRVARPRPRRHRPGESFEERRAKSLAEMARSEEIAAAVALRAGGLRRDRDAARRTRRGRSPTDVPATGCSRTGDVIVAAAGRPTRTPGALRAAVGDRATRRARHAADPTWRHDRRAHRRDRAGPRRREPARSSGSASRRTRRSRCPLKVDIDLGEVGGPSAGLPFALEVLQELGNDVDRGHRVVATGEIELDGTVGPIGGVKQKTLGAQGGGRGRLPRPGWGKRGRRTPLCREPSHHPCGRVFNRRCALCERFRRNSGICRHFAGLATPANCGDFVAAPLAARGDVATMAAVPPRGATICFRGSMQHASQIILQ